MFQTCLSCAISGHGGPEDDMKNIKYNSNKKYKKNVSMNHIPEE